MSLDLQPEILQISTAYPDLQIRSARHVPNAGQFSRVVIVNDSLVFRFSRSLYVAQEMAREVRLLRAIQGRVSLPIPNPIYIDSDPKSGTVRFMGYAMLIGESMSAGALIECDDETVGRVARQLAGFLRKLHAIPSASLGIDLPVEGTRDDWARMYAEIQDKLYLYIRPDAQWQVSASFDNALNDDSLWDFTPVLRHGDFGTSNILYSPDEKQITGIIDFGFCGLGDPAQDVGAVWTLGDNLMPAFFAAYPEMQATLPRVRFIRSTYALQQALYALRDGNQEDFEDGLRAYR